MGQYPDADGEATIRDATAVDNASLSRKTQSQGAEQDFLVGLPEINGEQVYSAAADVFREKDLAEVGAVGFAEMDLDPCRDARLLPSV